MRTDPPLLSFHGDPIPEIQRTFLDSGKGAVTLHVPCWEALHISGYQLSFNDGRHSLTLQSTKTKKKCASWCCDELKLICSDDQLLHLIGVSLEEEDGYNSDALAAFQEDIRFLVATYDRLFLEGSESYKPRKRSNDKKKNKSKNMISDGIVRKFGAKDLFVSVRSAMGIPHSIKGLGSPPENTATFESVALFLHMLSYMTEGSVERAGLTISLAVRGRNLPPSRLTFESETQSAGNRTPVPKSDLVTQILGGLQSHEGRIVTSATPSDSLAVSIEEQQPSDLTNLDGQVETKLTIYCSESLPDYIGCIPYSSRDLGTILVMVIMILFYLMCFVGFYTDVMEKYRNKMANSANSTSTVDGSLSTNFTNVTSVYEAPLCCFL